MSRPLEASGAMAAPASFRAIDPGERGYLVLFTTHRSDTL